MRRDSFGVEPARKLINMPINIIKEIRKTSPTKTGI